MFNGEPYALKGARTVRRGEYPQPARGAVLLPYGFSGEVKVSRKHTSFLLRDLPTLLGGAVEQLVSRWKTMDRRVEAYKGCGLADFEVNDLTIRALDASVLSASRIPDLLHEYRQPKHKAFEPRSLWSFFNAGTEVLKGALHMLPRRSQALHQICDQFVGLN